jgi:hypothetical protein
MQRGQANREELESACVRHRWSPAQVSAFRGRQKEYSKKIMLQKIQFDVHN